MITNYKKFNIKESIYTEKDMDDILDKGFKNFDESDLAVLNSYATDDKDLKEVIKKIRNYREPFELLNKQIKEEKDGIKKQQLFKKWLDMNEELTELENELKYKYKIEDLDKLKKLDESLNLNEKYEFGCILITIHGVEEALKTKKIINNFCLKYNIGNGMVNGFFNNIDINSFEEPIYVRLITSNSNDEIVLSWGKMSRFEDNQADYGYSYEKFFTIKDLEDGVLDNIKIYGKSDARPSYKPRTTRRTLDEGRKIWKYRFKTESEFKEQYGIDWGSRMQFENPDDDIGVCWAHDMNYLLGQPCEIEDIDMKQNLRYHLRTDRLTRGYWIITNEMLVKNENSEPSYIPKKFKKTFEGKNIVESSKYKFVIIEIESKDDYEKAQRQLLSQDFYWITDSRSIQRISRGERFPIYLFVIGENSRYFKNQFFYETKNELENGSVETTILRRQEDSKIEEICPKVFNIDDVKNIKNLFNYRTPPSYVPKKFNKTLEGFLFESLDKDTNEISIIVKNENDNERVQRDLFSLGYTWSGEKNVHTIKEEHNQQIITFYPIGKKHIVWCSSIAEFEYFKNSGWRYNSTIYTIDDWTRIVNFLRYGDEKPSYTPKKMNRTLESVTWYPYRVKTEKELREEFGGDWKRIVFNSVGWNPLMGNILGIDYPQQHFSMKHRTPEDEVSIRDLSSNRWIIPCMALKENEPIRVPSYKPKNTMRTLENINESFTFFYDNKDLESESNKPKFKIGDLVTIVPNGFEIHMFKIHGHYNEMDNMKEWMDKNVGKKLIVVDVGVNEAGLWVINCEDEIGGFSYIQQDALIRFAPSYQPRRVDRTI